MIISSDITWKSGETFSLTENIEISDGSSLIIEPGVIVEGNNFAIKNFGGSLTIGAANSVLRPLLLDVKIEADGSSTLSTFTIFNSDFIDGHFFRRQGASMTDSSDIHVEGSSFNSVEGFDLRFVLKSSATYATFTRNVFYESDEIEVTATRQATLVTFTNNLFVSRYDDGISSNGSGEASLRVENNSFYFPNSTPIFNRALKAEASYWGTSFYADSNFIEGATEQNLSDFIYDQNDSLESSGLIQPNGYTPTPAANTPKFDLDTDNPVSYGSLDDYHKIWDSAGFAMQNYDGGAGINTLDFSIFEAPLSIDLSKGTVSWNWYGENEKEILNFQNIIATNNADTLTGNTDNNVMIGNRGPDVLIGKAGDDSLYAGEGADSLDGGLGDDSLFGGGGSDIFIFSSAHGLDTIKDFNSTLDKIEYAGSSRSEVSWEKSLNNSGNDVIVFEENDANNKLIVESNFLGDSLQFNLQQNAVIELIDDHLTTTLSLDISGKATAHQAKFNSVKITGMTNFNNQIGSATVNTDPITISDVIAQLRDIVGLDKLRGKAHAAADIDNDGEVQIADVIENLRHIVGLDNVDTFDLVTDNGFAINALHADSVGNLSLVINGDADLSHADFLIV